MELNAITAVCVHEDGFIQVGWELPESEAEYLLITLPETDAPSDDEFFGHNHYVEIRDQLYGQYGGLDQLTVLNDHQVALRLNYAIPGLDAELLVTSTTAIPPVAMTQFRRAEALVRSNGN
jgi:hypothetical protein